MNEESFERRTCTISNSFRFESVIIYALIFAHGLSRIIQNATGDEVLGKTNVSPSGLSDDGFSDRTSRKMLELITTKVWNALPVVDIPRNWVLPYCTRDTEIFEEIKEAIVQCQYDGTDWDCTLIELGGGVDNFSMARIVSLFHEISDEGLRLKLLRGTEVCGKFWQRYKRAQERRLTRMGLNANLRKRKKRYSKKNRNLRSRKRTGRGLNKKNMSEKSKRTGHAIESMQTMSRKLFGRIKEHEKYLSPDDKEEVNRLFMTVTRRSIDSNLEEYPIVEDRIELTRLGETGTCLAEQAMKACEFIIFKSIQKLAYNSTHVASEH